jgi:hypothetical protein
MPTIIKVKLGTGNNDYEDVFVNADYITMLSSVGESGSKIAFASKMINDEEDMEITVNEIYVKESMAEINSKIKESREKRYDY